MRRRTHLKALASALAVPALAGCGAGADATGATRIIFWSWVPGIDQAVDLWNRTHPHIQVDLQDTPGGGDGTYAKMYAAIQGGRGGPDLAQIEYQELPSFVLENGMADLGPLGMDERSSDFVDWQLAQCTFGGHVYAVPQASGPMGLFYRKDIFAELDLDAPRTWDEFAEAASTVRESSPSRYICTFPPANAAWFASFAWQKGATWFSVRDSVWTVDIASEETLLVAEYWDDLRERDLVATVPDFSSAWYAAVQAGDIAAWPAAQWGQAMLAGNAPDTAGHWAVAPLPQWQETTDPVSSNWGGSTTAVFANSSHQAEAAEFAMWLNTDPDSIALLIEGGYGWPAAVGAVEGTALDQPDPFLDGQNSGQDVFIAADMSIDTTWMWAPTTASTYAQLADSFAAAVNGTGTFVDAVRQTHEATVADLRAKGLRVDDAA